MLKKSRKALGTMLLSSIIVSGLAIPAFAAVGATPHKYSTNTMIVDTTPVPSKSTTVEPIGINTRAAKTTKTVISKTTTDGKKTGTATSSSTVAEDTISAKIRVYKGGTLKGQKTTTLSKSRSAKATVTGSGIFNMTKAYGNHTYIKLGYKDVYHDTNTNFN